MASFILSYDVGTSFAIHQQLVAFVKANRDVKQWAQPFVGCFLLKSDANIVVLNAGFAEFFAGKTLFMLGAIDPNQTSGLLAPEIWHWLNQQENALSGLLEPYMRRGGIAPKSDPA